MYAQVQSTPCNISVLYRNMICMINIPRAVIVQQRVLLARELQPEGFIVVPITPGWVATDLGTGTVRGPPLLSC